MLVTEWTFLVVLDQLIAYYRSIT